MGHNDIKGEGKSGMEKRGRVTIFFLPSRKTKPKKKKRRKKGTKPKMRRRKKEEEEEES